MLTDVRLAEALAAAAETERAVRFHLSMFHGAAEQARGQVAYRHAVALRKSLEDWTETRAYRAAQEQQETSWPSTAAVK
jgi:hypothetical protein